MHASTPAKFNIAVLHYACRLTTLSQLTLGVSGAIVDNPVDMAATLAPLLSWQLQQQLALQPTPFTWGLQFNSICGWRAHEATWQALGRLSQLSRLVIRTPAGDENQTAVSMRHLSALAALSSCLQCLELRIRPLAEPQQQQDYAFLSSLTTLTGGRCSFVETSPAATV